MDTAALDRVLRPTSWANGLPNAHYTAQDLYEAERDRIVFAGWAALCFAHDVPEPGDALPVEFMGQPLLALRGGDGRVRVFQNVCRHRGMILVSAPRRVSGPLRCPYHSWCYSLTGALVSTPHVGGPGENRHADVDPTALSLISVRSHVWRGVVFVNLSGAAPPFEETAADLIARWAAFDRPLFAGGADCHLTFDLACNWKLAVENYCESYHLPWVHPALNRYSRLEDHYNISDGDAFSGQGTRVYRRLDRDGTRFPDFAGLDEAWAERAEYVALYPNLLLGIHRDHAFAIILAPLGPGRTRERLALFYSDAASATGPALAALRAENRDLWRAVFEEDIFVVEGMQAGRAARDFDGGRFSPVMDPPTHRFHRWIAAGLAARASS